MNRSHALVAALALALALPVAAQDASSFKPAPPPPGLNDPGVKAGEPDRSGRKPIERPVPYDQAQDGKTTPATSDANRTSQSPVALPSMQDDGGVDAQGNPPAKLSRSYDKEGNHVDEFTMAGKPYMVVVTPKNGVPQTYMLDQSGNPIHDPKNGPVSPVFYKVYEWGKAPKPAGSD
ncbi:DUF2782 domain-containing protein [Luteibacter sp.]|jgi:hypothetical protein|uniref:DUF2782 domain-containing protein n=1 Tax=Luteibacter sp. TaxID=1886636 RepID=UPI002F40A5AF